MKNKRVQQCLLLSRNSITFILYIDEKHSPVCCAGVVMVYFKCLCGWWSLVHLSMVSAPTYCEICVCYSVFLSMLLVRNCLHNVKYWIMNICKECCIFRYLSLDLDQNFSPLHGSSYQNTRSYNSHYATWLQLLFNPSCLVIECTIQSPCHQFVMQVLCSLSQLYEERELTLMCRE